MCRGLTRTGQGQGRCQAPKKGSLSTVTPKDCLRYHYSRDYTHCMRRGSFQEVVLDGAGRVRWNRVENLVAESAKSMNSSSGEQLWLVARWLLGDPGASMRKPLAAEVARLLDSAVAGAHVKNQADCLLVMEGEPDCIPSA